MMENQNLINKSIASDLLKFKFEKRQYDTCPVCSASIKRWREKKVGNETYKLDICKSCGYCFVNPRPSLNFILDYYSSFGHSHFDDISTIEAPNLNSVLIQEKNYPNSIIDAQRLIKTIKSLTKNANNNKFLDVGCGYGFFSKEALSVGFDIVALELAENEREIAKEMTGLEPAACSFEEFECVNETFQVVLMSQILEHALDINLWISKAKELLVKDGIIAIALPNYGSIFQKVMLENDPFICPPSHLNFFNPQSLSRLLKKHEFKIEEIQWVSRIPKTAYEKRLPKFAKPMLPIINSITSASLRTVDAFHLGMIINVYGRKTHS